MISERAARSRQNFLGVSLRMWCSRVLSLSLHGGALLRHSTPSYAPAVVPVSSVPNARTRNASDVGNGITRELPATTLILDETHHQCWSESSQDEEQNIENNILSVRNVVRVAATDLHTHVISRHLLVFHSGHEREDPILYPQTMGQRRCLQASFGNHEIRNRTYSLRC